jgi:hypothetical protein
MRRGEAAARLENESEGEGRERCDEIADALVGERSVGDLEVCGACGEWDGDEAVWAMETGRDGGAVERDLPGRIVAKVEDEGCRSEWCEVEPRRRW